MRSKSWRESNSTRDGTKGKERRRTGHVDRVDFVTFGVHLFEDVSSLERDGLEEEREGEVSFRVELSSKEEERNGD